MTLSGHQGTTIDMADALVGTDDYSRTFATLRGKLIGSNGERYVAFVRGLKPRYAIVYRDIAGLRLHGKLNRHEIGIPLAVARPVSAPIKGFI
jgi:hypothetical protein